MATRILIDDEVWLLIPENKITELLEHAVNAKVPDKEQKSQYWDTVSEHIPYSSAYEVISVAITAFLNAAPSPDDLSKVTIAPPLPEPKLPVFRFGVYV